MANLGLTLLCFILLTCVVVAVYFVFMPSKQFVEMTYKCDGKSGCTGEGEDCPKHGNKKECEGVKDCEWNSEISKMETFKKQVQVSETNKKERFSNRCSL